MSANQSANSVPPITLCLMAKAPVVGKVKTRMQPHLSPTRAAELAEAMLRHTIRTAKNHWRGQITLWVAPNPHHPRLRELIATAQIPVRPQPDTDLGGQMLAALEFETAGGGAAAVLGCDVPHISGAILAQTYELLTRGENPVGPAEDGGFYLLGLQRAEPRLFRQITWGSATVLTQLRARAHAIGLNLTALPKLRDIDTFADLRWLAKQQPDYRAFLPPPVE